MWQSSADVHGPTRPGIFHVPHDPTELGRANTYYKHLIGAPLNKPFVHYKILLSCVGDSFGLHKSGSAGDSWGLPRTPWQCWGLLGTSQDSRAALGTPGDGPGLPGGAADSQGLPRTPGQLRAPGQTGIAQDSRAVLETAGQRW